MSTNFSRPIPSDLYATTLQAINTALNDLARGLDPDTTGDHTVTPVGAIRWNAASKRWERFNGTSWPALASKFAIDVTGADTANSAQNLAGGVQALSIPIQTAPGATAYIAPPATPGAVLVFGVGASGQPSVLWTAMSGISVGSAATATNLSGGAVTTGANTTGATVMNATDGNVVVNGSSSTAALVTYRRGTASLKAGVDADNVYRVGGGSDGATYRFQVDSAGNFTARGNVTAYSDERFKAHWSGLAPDFLDRLVMVKAGTYERTDGEPGSRQAGVCAQDLAWVLPEAVHQDARGVLSVAYGQAALVAAVELAREVVRLCAELTALKQRVIGDD